MGQHGNVLFELTLLSVFTQVSFRVLFIRQERALRFYFYSFLEKKMEREFNFSNFGWIWWPLTVFLLVLSRILDFWGKVSMFIYMTVVSSACLRCRFVTASVDPIEFVTSQFSMYILVKLHN